MKCGDNEQCSNFKCPNGKYKTREEQIRTSTKNRDDRLHPPCAFFVVIGKTEKSVDNI